MNLNNKLGGFIKNQPTEFLNESLITLREELDIIRKNIELGTPLNFSADIITEEEFHKFILHYMPIVNLKTYLSEPPRNINNFVLINSKKYILINQRIDDEYKVFILGDDFRIKEIEKTEEYRFDNLKDDNINLLNQLNPLHNIVYSRILHTQSNLLNISQFINYKNYPYMDILTDMIYVKSQNPIYSNTINPITGIILSDKLNLFLDFINNLKIINDTSKTPEYNYFEMPLPATNELTERIFSKENSRHMIKYFNYIPMNDINLNSSDDVKKMASMLRNLFTKLKKSFPSQIIRSAIEIYMKNNHPDLYIEPPELREEEIPDELTGEQVRALKEARRLENIEIKKVISRRKKELFDRYNDELRQDQLDIEGAKNIYYNNEARRIQIEKYFEEYEDDIEPARKKEVITKYVNGSNNYDEMGINHNLLADIETLKKDIKKVNKRLIDFNKDNFNLLMTILNSVVNILNRPISEGSDELVKDKFIQGYNYYLFIKEYREYNADLEKKPDEPEASFLQRVKIYRKSKRLDIIKMIESNNDVIYKKLVFDLTSLLFVCHKIIEESGLKNPDGSFYNLASYFIMDYFFFLSNSIFNDLPINCRYLLSNIIGDKLYDKTRGVEQFEEPSRALDMLFYSVKSSLKIKIFPQSNINYNRFKPNKPKKDYVDCGERTILNLLNYLLADENGVFHLRVPFNERITRFYTLFPNIKAMKEKPLEDLKDNWGLAINDIPEFLEYNHGGIEFYYDKTHNIRPSLHNVIKLFNYWLNKRDADEINNIKDIMKYIDPSLTDEDIKISIEKSYDVIIIKDELKIKLVHVHAESIFISPYKEILDGLEAIIGEKLISEHKLKYDFTFLFAIDNKTIDDYPMNLTTIKFLEKNYFNKFLFLNDETLMSFLAKSMFNDYKLIKKEDGLYIFVDEDKIEEYMKFIEKYCYTMGYSIYLEKFFDYLEMNEENYINSKYNLDIYKLRYKYPFNLINLIFNKELKTDTFSKFTKIIDISREFNGNLNIDISTSKLFYRFIKNKELIENQSDLIIKLMKNPNTKPLMDQRTEIISELGDNPNKITYYDLQETPEPEFEDDDGEPDVNPDLIGGAYRNEFSIFNIAKNIKDQLTREEYKLNFKIDSLLNYKDKIEENNENIDRTKFLINTIVTPMDRVIFDHVHFNEEILNPRTDYINSRKYNELKTYILSILTSDQPKALRSIENGIFNQIYNYNSLIFTKLISDKPEEQHLIILENFKSKINNRTYLFFYKYFILILEQFGKSREEANALIMGMIDRTKARLIEKIDELGVEFGRDSVPGYTESSYIFNEFHYE